MWKLFQLARKEAPENWSQGELVKRLAPFFLKMQILYWDNRKNARNYSDLTHYRLKYTSELITLKDCFDKRVPGYPTHLRPFREVFSQVQPSRNSEAAVAMQGRKASYCLSRGNTDVSYIVPVLEACRLQELWGHGSFHPHFKRKALEARQPLKTGMREVLKMRICSREPRKLEIPGTFVEDNCRQWAEPAQERGLGGCNQPGHTDRAYEPFRTHCNLAQVLTRRYRI